MIKVLFVCMGNICRSPAAEGVFRELLVKRGMGDKVECGSAGTIGYHSGELPDSRMRNAARARGYDLRSRARQIAARDLLEHDYIIVMDERNYTDVTRLDPNGKFDDKIFRMKEFIKDADHDEIPDPYYGSAADFEKVLDLLEGASDNLLRFVLTGETV